LEQYGRSGVPPYLLQRRRCARRAAADP